MGGAPANIRFAGTLVAAASCQPRMGRNYLSRYLIGGRRGGTERHGAGATANTGVGRSSSNCPVRPSQSAKHASRLLASACWRRRRRATIDRRWLGTRISVISRIPRFYADRPGNASPTTQVAVVGARGRHGGKCRISGPFRPHFPLPVDTTTRLTTRQISAAPRGSEFG